MKKIFKRLSVLLVAVLIGCVSCSAAFAETIYYDNGLLYAYLNNDEVTICGAAEGVTEVQIPYYINYRYVVDIRNRAFLNNTEIPSVDFSNIAFLRRIGSFAFSGCTNLGGEVTIPSTVTSFETAAFQNCTSLTSVVIDAQNGEVPNQCFQGCTSLQSVTLNDTVTRIGYYAFDGCTALRYIEIPTTVTDIARSAFQNDENIILGVHEGSYAQEYAQNRGISYIVLETIKLGDANGDGYVNVNDVTAIQRHAAELELLEGINFHAADINGDGNVSVDDATELQRFLAEYVVDYPIGEVMTQ